jgi:VCBS repeat-containing protein
MDYNPSLSGDFSKAVVEDSSIMQVSGTVSHDDPLETLVFSLTQETGVYGAFTLGSGSGDWTYTLNNEDPDTTALATGDSVQETFVISVTDIAPGVSDLVVNNTVTVTITGSNDAPILGDTSATVVEERSIVINLLGADVDDVASALSYEVVSGQGPLYGNFVIDNSTGKGTYTHTSLLFEYSDSITYKVKDDDGLYSNDAEIDITIELYNDDPIISGFSGQVVAEDPGRDVVFEFTVTDEETGDADLTVVPVFTPASAISAWSLDTPDGSARTLNMTVAENFNGEVAVSVTVTDAGEPSGTPMSVIQEVMLTVNEVNDVPTLASIDDITLAELHHFHHLPSLSPEPSHVDRQEHPLSAHAYPG